MDHDHDHDHDHGGGGSGATCPMIMVFHGGNCERILWRGWVAKDLDFVLSCLAFFLLGILFEFLKFLRELLQKRENERNIRELKMSSTSHCANGSNACVPLGEINKKTYLEHLTSGTHLKQTSINVGQVALGYILMLVFMNYNYWLCLSVVLGIGLGYYLFGWIKQEVYDHDCC